MSKTVGAVIPNSLFELLEEEMVRKGYLSISETIRVILREYFGEKERAKNEARFEEKAAERLQPART